MFDFVRKIVLAAPAICCLQFAAYATDPALIDFPMACMREKNILGSILEYASEDPKTDPRNFRLVCKYWKGAVDGLRRERGQDGYWYGDQRPMWQKIERVARFGLEEDRLHQVLANAQLTYTFKNVTKKLSELKSPFVSGLNLSDFGVEVSPGVTAVEFCADPIFFFQASGEKNLILFATKAMIIKYMKSIEMSKPLKSLLEQAVRQWKEPVGFFWRYAKEGPEESDFTTYLSLAKISSQTMFQNWDQRWHSVRPRPYRSGGQRMWLFYVRFE